MEMGLGPRQRHGMGQSPSLPEKGEGSFPVSLPHGRSALPLPHAARLNDEQAELLRSQHCFEQEENERSTEASLNLNYPMNMSSGL